MAWYACRKLCKALLRVSVDLCEYALQTVRTSGACAAFQVLLMLCILSFLCLLQQAIGGLIARPCWASLLCG